MVTGSLIVNRLVFVVILIMLVAGIGWAQDITFTATVDKTKVALDDQLQLQLTISGSQDSVNPELPVLNGFELISSGSSSQFSFINGVMSASRTFTYLLLPTTEGKITIGPAKVILAGKVYETEPIMVEVLPKGKSTPAPARQPGMSPAPTYPAPVSAPPSLESGFGERIFIEITTDKQQAYIGEQIVLTFRLYFRDIRIDNLRYAAPVTKGFVTEAMGQQREFREMRDGVAYNVIELKTALFPVSAGSEIIEPAKLQCDLLVRTDSRRRSGSGVFDEFFDDSFFFPSYNRQPVALSSKPLTINAKPLPTEGKPESFRGAVGTYDLTVTASPESLRAGEPINLVMKVSGAGNIGAVAEPLISNLEGFKAYEAELKTEITGRDNEIVGNKTFQKIIIPKNDKITEIPEIIFSYFDPLKKEYRTVNRGPIAVKVLPAEKRDTEILELIRETAPEAENQKAIQLLARDIHFIKTSPEGFTSVAKNWYQNLWLGLGFLLVTLLLLLLSWLFNAYRIRLKEDSAFAKAKGAFRTARSLLNDAGRYEKENNIKDFYDTLARTVHRYITDRLNFPVGSVSNYNINSLLSSAGIRDDVISRLKALLDNCDLARFSAATFSKADMRKALEETNNLLRILTKRL